MFVGRETELALLEEIDGRDGFQMTVVYGRRRVGKTSLLHAFADGRPDVHFFTARDTTAHENLVSLSAALLAPAQPAGAGVVSDVPLPVFTSFEQALESAFIDADDRRTMLVIDEYPYLAASYPGVSSLLQVLIDRYQTRSKLHLILCGSSMSFMEHQVLGEKGPLYGRRTAQLKVLPWDCFDAARLFKGADPVRLVELYGLVGGIPLYLEQLDAAMSMEDTIASRMLASGAFLRGEPQAFLLQELRTPSTYNAVVTAIATGSACVNEIAGAAGISSTAASNALGVLGELGIVKRVTPLVKANKKQVKYCIADNLFRFWYRFVPRYATALDAGLARAVADRIIQQEFPTYMGPLFEEVCRQWLVRQVARGAIDIMPAGVGTWWGTDPVARQETDIDVVMAGIDGELVLGECKWRSEPVGVEVLETLLCRSSLLVPKGEKRYMLFSRSGFTVSCVERARQRGDVRLVNVDEMFA